MLTRLSHTTAPSARETMSAQDYARMHARNLDLKADPVALQRWAVTAKGVIEQLLESKG